MTMKIRQAAVIGSGIMGGGIAALLAGAGIETWLLDIVPPDLKPEEQDDPAARNRIVEAGWKAAANARPALLMHPKESARVHLGNLSDDIEVLAQCDWIVEAVVENLKIKQDLFHRVDALRHPQAIISTNTSGLPLNKISEGFDESFRQHFLGTHFFNPVRYMKLLEIIPGADTLPEILDFMADFGERRLGKGIVWAKDTPNFVGNRIGVHGMVKALQLMAQSDLTIPEVDAIFGPAMGRPKTAMFKTADLVGLDILAHVAQNTYDLVPEDEDREAFLVPDFVRAMLDKKLLGKKTKAGFYKTDLTPEWKKVYKVLDLETFEYGEFQRGADFPCLKAAKKAKSAGERIKTIVYGDDRGARFAWQALAHNLVYAARRIPEIADTIVEIDNSLKWGFNFELGPFEAWDAIGVAESVAKMEAEGISVPENVKAMLAAGNTAFYQLRDGQPCFYDFNSGQYQPVKRSAGIISLSALKTAGKAVKSCPSASLVDLDDGVFCLEFHSKMNAINGEIVDFMTESLDFIQHNGAGLVIGNQAGGMPGAFSAGGDLAYMGQLAQAGKFAEMDQFLQTAQSGMQAIRYAPLPVVAAPFGLALGGGCEICLGAADRVVAHAELYMGLVEIGVGLLPAGGGCLNLWKKFIATLPEAVSDIDLGKFFVPVFMNIAMAKVSSSAADARALGFLNPQDRIVANREHLIGEAKKEVLRLLADGYAPPLRGPVRVMGEAAQGMAEAELFNFEKGGFVSEYDAFLARRVAYVVSGGNVRSGASVPEETILKLEREAFLDFWHQEKTLARITHMQKTGKPLRN
ncbi:MAG: 3-hydroxyacyl-CoA dehydrogenase/enoyl-CoA hydratase family protein [Desulfobacterales bacterium]|jgi:3-hydroxyacyl-CoA dehydrogenase